MKKVIIIIALIIVSSNCFLKAQTENSYNQISNFSDTSQYNKMLKYFLLEKTDVKKLFKIDLIQLALKRPNFSFEKKLPNNSSVEIECLASLYYPGNYRGNIFDFNLSEKVFYFNINSDYKYYYNTKKRTLKGKNTNGFSANYISIGLSAHLNFYDKGYYKIFNDGIIRDKYVYDNPWNDINPPSHNKVQFVFGKHEARENTGYIKFGYGLQRRIGNIGYASAELKLGFGSNEDFSTLYIMPEINIKAGFAIKSFKRR